MGTVVEKFAKQQKAERKHRLRRAVFARLESVWEDMHFLASVGNMPEAEAQEVVAYAFDSFVAEAALGDDLTREQFLEEMGEAYDDAKKAEEEDGEEVEDGNEGPDT
jgi:hypothetical protein